jgi:hypothetical protein
MSVQDDDRNPFPFFGEFYAAVRLLRHKSLLLELSYGTCHRGHFDRKGRRDIPDSGDFVGLEQNVNHFQIIFKTLS